MGHSIVLLLRAGGQKLCLRQTASLHTECHAVLSICLLQVEGAVNIAAIACGGFHNLALVADGSVLSWGTNDYGQVRLAVPLLRITPACLRTDFLSPAFNACNTASYVDT